MIQKLYIKNFKKFDEIEIPLEQNVVFIGPNNSGKTTALQALYLWNLGFTKWIEKKSDSKSKDAVAIYKKDIFAISTPHARNLWKDLKARKANSPLSIEICLEFNIKDKIHNVGFEYKYFSEELIYCKPLEDSFEILKNLNIKDSSASELIKISYLPPMSGLYQEETKLQKEAILYRIGEGRTAEVLRNVCHSIYEKNDWFEWFIQDKTPFDNNNWEILVENIKDLFGVKLNPPVLNSRSNIELTYEDQSKNTLDISSSGRGLQQVVLLMGYMLLNKGATILLDEPDAHLEIIRQRNIYNQIQKIASINENQIIIASHSEVIMNEAAVQDSIIAFVGNKPHKINDKGSQLLKSLTSIGFEDYYQAESKGKVLYLEGPTDKSVLEAYAEKLKHPSIEYFKNGFIKYTANNLPNDAKSHFYGLKEAVSNLKAVGVFDKLEKEIDNKDSSIFITTWKRREIENYFFNIENIKKYAAISESSNSSQLDFVELAENENKVKAMEFAIEQIIPKIAQTDPNDSYWTETKASEQLDRIFKLYFQKLGLPIKVQKRDYFKLISESTNVDEEILEKLNLIQSRLIENLN